MKWSYVALTMSVLVGLATLLSLPSCGHDQKLLSIQIQPSSFTFLTADAGQTEQLTALGTYIHPPAQKDITSQATWKVDDGVVTVTAGKVTTPGGTCGGADISATMPEGTGGPSNIIVGYATVTVNDPTNPICPGGGTQATLSVNVTPVTDGTVTSLTGGINCPTGKCVAVFAVGSSVALVATPAQGKSLLTWTGCTSSTGNDCTVTIPVGGTVVTATFN